MLYEYWLAQIKHLSAYKKRKLREIYGSGKAVYNIEETKFQYLDFLDENDRNALKNAKKERNLQEKFDYLINEGIRFLPYFDREYPEKLRSIAGPPYALYVKGKLPDENTLSVAIVGARRCTSYGESMALEYGSVLASAGVQIISGMARGIDGAAQRGALNGGGSTYGILGCGVDICYPRDNIGLYMDMQAAGGVLSEQCPGEPPLPAYFPQRNRIISALSDIVIVVEAREKSGSLITADMALEQGKDIYALPGPVTSPLSQGCHQLIRQGAGILISPEDLLRELEIGGSRTHLEPEQNSDKNKKVLETAENLVYSCLGFFPKSMSQLLSESKVSSKELIRALASLEIEGRIKEVSKNYYIKAR